MGNIVLLDDLTINKIAAGEVIERPASVIKELVENSIDAGATNISVEIKNGGISYIRVTDNGKGIMPDDMEIAFERHATSKIRTADDLETVKSMGFRGEALASIAAIAKVNLKSKTEDNETGYEIVVEGGNILSKKEVGCPKGTTIAIENLFYNTPVRYKFLKKDFTEAGYIEDVITRIALVNPKIAIRLINSGKTIIQTTGNGDVKSVVYSIYGKEVAENILDVNYQYEDIKVIGVVGKPAIARSNRANQLFFVNKRYIKDKTLTSSAEQAFKGMITIGKFGFVILNLDMNPQKVDVNVHPAKLEVRFEEEGKVFKAVYHAIKDTLLKGDLVNDTEKDYNSEKEKVQEILPKEEKALGGLFRRQEEKQELPKNNFIEDIYKSRMNNTTTIKSDYNDIINKMAEMQKSVANFKNEIKTENIAENVNTESIQKSEDIYNSTSTYSVEQAKENKIEDTNKYDIETKNTSEISDETKVIKTIPSVEETQVVDMSNIIEKSKELDNVKMEHDNNFEEMYTSIFGTSVIKEDDEKYQKKESFLDSAQIATGENISMFEKEKNAIPEYKFIGIAFDTYIIIELEKELYIIDQHAAHERIMYEKIKANYYSDTDKDSQLMLLPDIITLTHKEMGIAKDNIAMFEKAGFTLEEFGENTIKLTGVPNVCIDLDTKELFLETLDEINTVARTAKQEIEEKFIATVACKAAVKAHMALTKEEVDSLMQKLLRLPNPFTCPHGRPTAIKMTKNDIEKKFSRR